MKHLSIALLLLFTGCMSFKTDRISELTDKQTLPVQAGFYLPYTVYSPKVTEGEKYPVCIFLHDTDKCGSDNNLQMSEGVNSIIDYVIDSDTPAFVVAPQCPADHTWCDMELEVALDTLISVFKSRDDVDPDRIYLTGFGMGGEGTWNFALEFPDDVVTIAPVCGGALAMKQTEDPVVPIILMDMNIWAIHYLDDRVRTTDLSKKILSAVWTQNVALAKYTEFMRGGHTADIYKDPGFLGWMFATRKATSTEEEDN